MAKGRNHPPRRNAGGVAANSRWQAAEGRAATGCCAEPICTPDGVLDGYHDGSGTPSGVHRVRAYLPVVSRCRAVPPAIRLHASGVTLRRTLIGGCAPLIRPPATFSPQKAGGEGSRLRELLLGVRGWLSVVCEVSPLNRRQPTTDNRQPFLPRRLLAAPTNECSILARPARPRSRWRSPPRARRVV